LWMLMEEKKEENREEERPRYAGGRTHRFVDEVLVENGKKKIGKRRGRDIGWKDFPLPVCRCWWKKEETGIGRRREQEMKNPLCL
jgi:hypothetical protein